jgi:hypothetical protein
LRAENIKLRAKSIEEIVESSKQREQGAQIGAKRAESEKERSERRKVYLWW